MGGDLLKVPFSRQSYGGVFGTALSMATGFAIWWSISSAVAAAMLYPAAWIGPGIGTEKKKPSGNRNGKEKSGVPEPLPEPSAGTPAAKAPRERQLRVVGKSSG
jgi:hypothetical protein